MQTPNTPQLTPIEKEIEELKLLQNKYPDDHRFNTIISFVATQIESLLPYERQYLRDVAEKAWDAGETKEKFIGEWMRESNLYYENIAKEKYDNTPGKQTYLNQKHPL